MSSEISVARDLIRSIVGKECWAVCAGPGTGSHFTMEIGKKIPRARPIRNRFPSEVARKYAGEFGLFFEACAWRVEGNGGILCTSKSDNRFGGEMLYGLHQIIGRRILRVKIEKTGFDLTVEFERGLFLRSFSDAVSDEEGDNYYYSSPEESFTVEPKGQIRFGKSQ